MNSRRIRPPSACVFASLTLAASGWLGCSPPIAVDSADSSANAPSQGIELSVVDRAGYEAVVERLRGQVVLVDFWATWCLPCLEQLPHSVELAEQEGKSGLAVVTGRLGGPQMLAPVRPPLAPGVVSEYGGGSRSVEEFDVTGGATPYYKLYDRSGKLRQTFGIDPAAERQFTPADIDAAVAKLLAE